MTGFAKKLKAWFFQGITDTPGVAPHQKDPWWKVMCLTGVDYFSSMGFQPGISFLAAGLLSPMATLFLVILNLFGALPAYWIVARESPHGQGSFAIFEKMLRGWRGKTLVLILLGFAATDFIFTITMCAADATAHIVQNPWVPELFRNHMLDTFILIAILGAVFLKGFEEAIAVSFGLVIFYLAVNAVILSVCVSKIAGDPELISAWLTNLRVQYPSLLEMIKTSALVFPQLALGMSGFETGVAVMPLIKSNEKTPESLDDRIRNTRLLLVTVAVIMSVFLIVGSLVTTILIPAPLYQENQPANGRALAYLAHLYLGPTFGTLYDAASIAILWFAGASGMAALLSLVPQYLPRYGMAPSWAGARRPLVAFFTACSLLITFLFRAKVDPQAPPFATGLLVMITSAVIAVTLIVWKKSAHLRFIYVLISAVFVYSTLVIVRDRPEGLHIASFFIIAVLSTSLISRALRAMELRVKSVKLDEKANEFIQKCCADKHQIRLLAHRPGHGSYKDKEWESRRVHDLDRAEGKLIFLEVTPADVSDFSDDVLEVRGEEIEGFEVLKCSSPSVPNAIAALLLYLRDTTKTIPNAYFGWTEGHPLPYVAKYILLGEGETAPVTREILREAEPDPTKRPRIHVA